MPDQLPKTDRTVEEERGRWLAHTPGPWTAHDDDGTGTMPCVLASQVTSYGNFYVAQCTVYANARLIAATPDLLDALIALRSACDGNGDKSEFLGAMKAADQAIEKAIGK